MGGPNRRRHLALHPLGLRLFVSWFILFESGEGRPAQSILLFNELFDASGRAVTQRVLGFSSLNQLIIMMVVTVIIIVVVCSAVSASLSAWLNTYHSCRHLRP